MEGGLGLIGYGLSWSVDQGGVQPFEGMGGGVWGIVFVEFVLGGGLDWVRVCFSLWIRVGFSPLRAWVEDVFFVLFWRLVV